MHVSRLSIDDISKKVGILLHVCGLHITCKPKRYASNSGVTMAAPAVLKLMAFTSKEENRLKRSQAKLVLVQLSEWWFQHVSVEPHPSVL